MIDESEHKTLVSAADFPTLLEAIARCGYTLIGPTIRDHAIAYDEIENANDLPAGWTDQQKAGSYRLTRRDDNAFFGYNVGPNSWKKFLYPPRLRLWKAHTTDSGFELEPQADETTPQAFVGVRACELQAIAVQDRVLLEGRHVDTEYAARRNAVFLLAVQCAQAGQTCFCTSMGTGPRAKQGFDLALTELIDEQRHEFLVEVGSKAGADVLAQTPHRPATDDEWNLALQASARAAEEMGRQLDTTEIKELLYRNAENSRWDDVAQRCLACANCTMVCPTCFCTAIDNVTNLTGETAEQLRRWDSCFNSPFSYLHGGAVRQTTKSRYRQWLTHKFAAWHDQFNSSGCVGCGRCITWCPVGIDVTEEIAAIRANDAVPETETTLVSS